MVCRVSRIGVSPTHVVALPRALDGLIGVHRGEAGVRAVAVAAARLATLLDRLEAGPGAEGLEAGRGRVRLLERLDDLVERRLVGRRVERLELAAELLVQRRHAQAGEAHRDGLRGERHQTALVDRVVEDLRLEHVVARLELAPDAGVADRDGQRLLGDVAGVGDHGHAALQQRAVRELLQRRLLDNAVARDLRVLHEHVRARDADVGELDEPVVDALPTHLRAEVADVDARQQGERLGVAQRDDERLGAVRLALDDELREDGAVGRRRRCATDPPLRRQPRSRAGGAPWSR